MVPAICHDLIPLAALALLLGLGRALIALLAFTIFAVLTVTVLAVSQRS